MIQPIVNENAAVRHTYVSEIYDKGTTCEKKFFLDELPKEYAKHHLDGYIHIHDLESFGKVYNCSMPDFQTYMENRSLSSYTNSGKIFEIFANIKLMIINVANSQTGGIGFLNFDSMISEVFDLNGVTIPDAEIDYFYDCISDLLRWINETNTRYCREPYYLTFNMGLDTTPTGKLTTKTFISAFMDSPMKFTRPNIVFKVNNAINKCPESENYDIYKLALKCTAKRMIPTYLLTNSAPNEKCEPSKLGIMGCRTRVYQNINGKETSLGRGNIANISINLPRIALESSSISEFYLKLDEMMNLSKEILLYRVKMMYGADKYNLSYIFENKIWANVSSIEELVKQGTLSIGFIGLSEVVDVLLNQKCFNNIKAHIFATEIIEKMRIFVDNARNNENLNYSLLASPGEMISGRFCNIDKELKHNRIHDKGFYTNSFHAEVDSGITIYEKIRYEAPFHNLCNGGCITYIELNSAPLSNILALEKIISFSIDQGISYLGFNYPLDICNECGTTGTFDCCELCNSKNIKRIRRVSGYLEELSHFTDGKKAEVSYRKSNI